MMSPGKRVSAAHDDTEYFPIRVLSERTGVGSSTLRAWERRYGLLNPQRTPKGHRLYNSEDLRLVEYILTLMDEGHSLAAIARQTKRKTDIAKDDEERHERAGVWSDYQNTTLRAIHDFSAERVEAVYNEASSLYPVDMVTERLIEPVLAHLGNNWQLRDLGIAEEHFYSHWVRNRLGARFHHASSQASGTRILCACLPDSYHEIGLMLFTISALTRGYRVLYLGANLPLAQIPAVISRSGTRGVVLSSRADIDRTREQQLADLVNRLNVPVLLGGRCSDHPLRKFEQAGGVRLGSNIGIALRVLDSHVPAFGAGAARAR